MKKGRICIILGLLCLAASFVLAGTNICQGRLAYERAMKRVTPLLKWIEENRCSDLEKKTNGHNAYQDVPLWERYPDMDMPVAVIDGEAYIGILEIPSMDLKLPILKYLTNANLQNAPCRYEGSAYLDNMIIAAHNYRNHFGQISGLAMGSEVRFTDMAGNVFSYQVSEQEIIGGYDIPSMKNGDWDLTLFTCTYSGQSRVTIRCVRK